jgi:hypothetical protein
MRKCPAVLAMMIGLLVLTLASSYAHAQFMSNNFRGDFGVLAGTQPPPGWWAAAGYVAAIGLVVPTGSYDPDALDNLGLEMWSFELSGGATWYPDAAGRY